MRVGQLARKLGISPTELINFLTSAGIQTLEGSNTKLSQENLQTVIKHFDPTGKLEATFQEDKQEELKEETDASVELVTPVFENTSSPIESSVETTANVEPVASVNDAVSDNSDNKIEVIKAPKVELAGLKVLGKIELPEKKKKEPAENTSTEPTTSSTEAPRPPRGEARERNPRHQRTRTDREASRKNPVAMKREQEAAEAERKRLEEAKLAKERRTQHYLSKVKSVPTKPARLIQEEVVELHAEQNRTPTTWLGKFWKWFRS